MTRFIDTAEFAKLQSKFLPGDTYSDLQKELAANPEKGRVMQGCGGLRKIRVADPRRRKGKRGGARVIYLHIPEVDQFLMLDVYSKGEKENLTPAERKRLRTLAQDYKTKTIEACRAAEKERSL